MVIVAGLVTVEVMLNVGDEIAFTNTLALVKSQDPRLLLTVYSPPNVAL